MHGLWYVSFFSSIGKATFLKHFFGHATFITSGNLQGTLADTALQGETYERGYFAFLRLIGTVYLRDTLQHLSIHHQLHTFTSSIQMTLLPYTTTKTGSTVLERPSGNEQHMKIYPPMMPCFCTGGGGAGWLMWRQANVNTMTLQPLTNFGWQLDYNDLKMMWDSLSNIQQIKSRVRELLQGCKCKTGCFTVRCGRKRL